MASKETSYDPNILSVIVVNFNGGELLSQCLMSILSSEMESSLRVYVVDNASTDGSKELVEGNFPRVDVIANTENVGFAIANNQVLRMVDSGFVALVNPDVVLPPEVLNKLKSFLLDHPDAGVVGPKQVDSSGVYNPASKMGKATVSDTVFKYLGLSRIFPRSKVFAGYYLGHLGSEETSRVDAVSGACLMARTDVLKKVDYFDERFPLGCEDLDLCFRVAAVASIYYFPEAVVIHEGRQSRKKYPELSIMKFTEGAKLLYLKHEAANHPEWFNTLVLKGLELQAVARIGLTKLRDRRGKQE